MTRGLRTSMMRPRPGNLKRITAAPRPILFATYVRSPGLRGEKPVDDAPVHPPAVGIDPPATNVSQVASRVRHVQRNARRRLQPGKWGRRNERVVARRQDEGR